MLIAANKIIKAHDELQIMDILFVKSLFSKLIIVSSVLFLSACVTQKFENDTPVVQTQANKDEMAATRISLGLGYLKMGNMSQAKLNLEKAKIFSPELVQVYTAFAHFYEKVGEYDLTEQSYQKALSIKSDDADTLNNYGVFLCRQKKVAQAEVQFLKAIAVPSYILVSRSYENLSACYLKEDNFAKAEFYLEKAILHSPNRTTTLFQMVRLQYAMGNIQQAKIFQQKFEKNTRRFSSESLALAYKVYLKLGQRRTAKNYGTMLVKMYPKSWEARQYLLNDLELIEADNLAQRYQLTKKITEFKLPSSDSKKRVVKLSPHRKKTTAITQNKKLLVNKSTIKSISQRTAVAVEMDNSKVIDASTAKEAGTKWSSTQLDNISVGERPVGIGHDELPAIEIETTTTTASEPPTLVEQHSVQAIQENNNALSRELVADQLLSDKLSAVTLKARLHEGGHQESNLTEGTLQENTVLDKSEVESQKSTNIPSRVTVNTLMDETVISLADTEVNIAVVDKIEPDIEEPTSTFPVAAKRDVPLPKANDLVTLVADRSMSADNYNQTIEIESVDKEVTEEVKLDEVLAEPTVPNELDKVKLQEELLIEDGIDKVALSTIDLVDKLSTDVKNKKRTVFHKINPGETLFAISVKYNVKINALRLWNNISAKSKLRIGDKLYVVNPKTVTDINE